MPEVGQGEGGTELKGKKTGEAGFVGVEHGTFDDVAADGVGAIENVEGDVVLGGFFHAVGHRGGVGVEAHASVLNVEDERVDSAEHLVRGAKIFAVEAEDGETGGGI